MIHYHGTPLTPIDQLFKMSGKHFCVSFARPDDAERCLQIAQSIMWDNGAFTSYTKGLSFDFTSYCDWLEDRLGHPHWCVIPDVIGGSVEEQKKLIKKFPYPSELSAPVWHLNLSLDYLLYLTDNFPKVCFGSSGDYWEVGSEKWCSRIDETFNLLSQKNKIIPYIHMLRGLSLGGSIYPFASADSTNVARNFKDKGKCPELMARKIDGMQNPIKWKFKPTQKDFFKGVNDGSLPNVQISMATYKYGVS